MQNILLFLPALFVWLWVAIFFHELAHFLTGRALGLAPYALVVGKGPQLLAARVRGAAVRLHLIPAYGMVFVPARDLGGAAWRHVAFFSAGLISDAVLLTLLAVFMFSQGGATLTVLGPIAFFHLCIILANLWPTDVNIAGTVTANDGKLILGTLQGGTAFIAQRHRDIHAAAVQRYDPAFRAEDAWITRAAPEMVALYHTGLAAAEIGDLQVAFDQLTQVLAAAPMSPGEEAQLLDSLASSVLFRHDSARYPQALEWAGRARARLPGVATLSGTHGALLIESGAVGLKAPDARAQEDKAPDALAREQATADIRAGLALLLPLTEEGNTPIDRTISTRYIAQACALLGEAAQAAEWKKRSRANGASPAPWADQKVRGPVRFAACFFLLAVGVGLMGLVASLFREGLPRDLSWNLVGALVFMVYGTWLFGYVAIRGKAPPGWLPWK